MRFAPRRFALRISAPVKLERRRSAPYLATTSGVGQVVSAKLLRGAAVELAAARRLAGEELGARGVGGEEREGSGGGSGEASSGDGEALAGVPVRGRSVASGGEDRGTTDGLGDVRGAHAERLGGGELGRNRGGADGGREGWSSRGGGRRRWGAGVGSVAGGGGRVPSLSGRVDGREARGRASRFEAGGRGCERSAKRARGDAPMFAGLCEGDKGPAARVVSRRAPVLCAERLLGHVIHHTGDERQATSGRARLVVDNDDRQSMKSKGRAQLCRVRPFGPALVAGSNRSNSFTRRITTSPLHSSPAIAERVPGEVGGAATPPTSPSVARRPFAKKPPRAPSSSARAVFASHPAAAGGHRARVAIAPKSSLTARPGAHIAYFRVHPSRAPRIAPDPSCKSARSPGREDRPGWGP